MSASAISQSWWSWLAEHGPRLLLFARQQCAEEGAAEDIFQEAFLRLWRSGQRQPPDRPGAYYLAIRRAALDWGRSRQRRRGREDTAGREGDPATVWFECPFAREEEARALESCLRQLPREQREVLTLKIWGECTFQEIGRILEIPLPTAASRYRLALESLRENWPSEALATQPLADPGSPPQP